MLQKNILVLKMLFKSTSSVTMIALFTLPVAIMLFYSSILFIHTITHSFEQHLLLGYKGVYGQLSLGSQNKDFLNKVKNKTLNFQSTYKKTAQKLLYIKINGNIIKKNTKVVVYETDFFEKKFANQSSGLVINQSLWHQIGKTSNFLLKSKETKKWMGFKNLKIVDTGYLDNKPTIIISKKLFTSLLPLSKLDFDKIEFDEPIENIETIVQSIKEVAYKISADYVLYDILKKSDELSSLFKKVDYIEMAVTAIVLIIVLLILFLSFRVIVMVKKRSLEIFRILGISRRVFSQTFVIICSTILLIGFCGSFVLLFLSKKAFTAFTDFTEQFFVPLSSNIYIIFAIFSLLFLMVSYGLSKIIFQRKVEV